jgi:putative ABC transport system permease protein
MTIFSLALKNLQRKPFRTWALAIAVAIAGAAVFATATVMWGIERSLEIGFSKFGADLLVVPRNALVNMKSALLTGEPSTFYMKADILDEVKSLSGVAKVAPQVFLTTAAGSHCIIGNAFLVGFDPRTDFTVLPWLFDKARRPLAHDDAIVGGNNPYQVGETIYFYGKTFNVYGKLDRTGIGLYDNAIFISLDKAYELAEESTKFSDVPPLGFGRGDISAVLIRVGHAAKANLVRFAIAKNPTVKVITAGNIVTSVRQNLTALFAGTVALAVVLVIGNGLMIGAVFSTIVNERKRELGLVRAVGARRPAIFGLVISESALLTTLGGLLGIALGVVLMRIYARSIGFHLESLNIPFLWPPLPDMALVAAACVGLALLVGTLGALYPALTGSRMEPYDAIRAGE